MREGTEAAWTTGPSARVRALAALGWVDSGTLGSQAAVQQALEGEGLGGVPIRDLRDRALVTELVYGTLRRQRTLDLWLKRSCQRGLVGIDRGALQALRMGAHQVTALRIPAFAAVAETVEAFKVLTTGRRARPEVGFVHAVLRKLAGRAAAGDMPLAATLPDWIAHHSDALAADLGLDPAALATAWGAPAPLHLHALRDGVLAQLQAEGLALTPLAVPHTAEAAAASVHHPRCGYDFLLQDVASAAVTAVTAVSAGERVLDLAAGRGVKTAALSARGAEVTAVDLSAAKLAQAAQLVGQVGGTPCTVLTADAAQPLDLPQQSFDLVLLDAPCSALGTLRRRPEVRHRRRAADVFALAQLQRAMSAGAAQMVRPGGRLVLATCSITAAEGPLWLTDFLFDHKDFEIEPVDEVWAQPWRDRRGCLRTHPLWLGADGFFVARLRRRP